MFRNIVKKVFGDPMERAISEYREVIERINKLEPNMQKLSDDQFQAKTKAFQDRLNQGETLTDILVEAFAVVREASVRTIGLRHYDVQLIGGMVLHEGQIAEMKTGEGKTLVATLPIYLNALTGKGAHLVTPNDYLSKYGLQTMGPIYSFLGLSAAVIQNTGGQPDTGSYLFDANYLSDDARYQNLRPITRREAYAADITYGTNNEFGFDYLRDNMVLAKEQLTQRDLNYAIIDEVDNILIDEARTPLIISGPADEPSDNYRRFAEIVKRLKPSSQESVDDDDREPDGDYVVDIKDRITFLSEAGVEKVQQILGVEQLYDPAHAELLPYLDNCLRAQVLYQNNKEYIVQDGEVVIVDDFTGRLMPGRRFSEGLHQAIEAKEGVEVRRENMTLATITFQNFFRMYDKLSGMTGTALTEAEEFEKIYELAVVPIPTNLPIARDDAEDLIYMNETAKWNAIVNEIRDLQENNQPVLIGTVAIETSERLSKRLNKAKIPHDVLNAKAHESEAGIIAQAGRPGAVTIATNMAGRGVDILLGGNPEGLARESLRKQGVDVTEATDRQWKDAFKEAQHICEKDREIVLNAGGLYVLGTERHEARRIDNQLRGRSGRQGDPGETRFFLSLDDELMKRFAQDRVKKFMKMANMPEDQPIEHGMISKSIEQAQIRVEGHNFDIRKRVLDFDDVVNRQRGIIYGKRKEWLNKSADGLHSDYFNLIEERIGIVLDELLDPESNLDNDAIYQQLVATGLPVPPDITTDSIDTMDDDDLQDRLIDFARERLDAKRTELEAVQDNLMERAERQTILRSIDQYWQRHLTDLDILRESIGLMASGGRDPLVEYQREAFRMFQIVQDNIDTLAARQIFLIQAAVAQRQPIRRKMQAIRPTTNGNSAPVQQTVQKVKRPGRNDPCHCGSGKKYKHCHMREDRKAARVKS